MRRAIKNGKNEVLHSTTHTTVRLITAIRTLVLSVTPEPQRNTRPIVTSELIGRAVYSSRSSHDYHAHKTDRN